jgi:hypothetical protein
MGRTPAPEALPSVIGGPSSDFNVSALSGAFWPSSLAAARNASAAAMARARAWV